MRAYTPKHNNIVQSRGNDPSPKYLAAETFWLFVTKEYLCKHEIRLFHTYILHMPEVIFYTLAQVLTLIYHFQSQNQIWDFLLETLYCCSKEFTHFRFSYQSYHWVLWGDAPWISFPSLMSQDYKFSKVLIHIIVMKGIIGVSGQRRGEESGTYST